ncbi:MAG: hypothetical protein HIU89_18305, partial [Proteobacteria bacterium]|nr:hypothetical protein [Pseudomonadota bacterium]
MSAYYLPGYDAWLESPYADDDDSALEAAIDAEATAIFEDPDRLLE